jgi:hypothetical protein
VVDHDAKSVSDPHPMTNMVKHPCLDAKTFFTGRIESLKRQALTNHTVIVSNEELETNPAHIWERIASLMDLREYQKVPNLGDFLEVRVNAQIDRGKG